MSCNCIKEVKESLIERFNKREDIKEVTNVSMENTALMFNTDGPAMAELYSPIKIEYDYLNSKGETKHKKEKANMAYKYCPFCGKPYLESEVK